MWVVVGRLVAEGLDGCDDTGRACKEHELVSTRLSHVDVEQVDRLVGEGIFLNRADFLRQAVREKLSVIEMVKVRDVGFKEAKKEVLQYLEKHQVAYPSDIAMDLGLEIMAVMRAVKDLLEGEEVEEAI